MKTLEVTELYKDILDDLKEPAKYRQAMEASLDFVHKSLRVASKESREIVEFAIRLASEQEDHVSLARLHYYRGWLHMDTDDFSGGLENFEICYKLFEKTNNLEMMIRTLSSLGFCYTSIGNPAEAFKSYDKAFELATAINDEKAIAQISANMGESFLALGQHEDALGAFKRSYALETFSPNRVVILERIGYIYHLMDRTEEGLPYLQEGLELANKEKLAMLTIQVSKALGETYASLGDLDKAIELVQEATEQAKDNNLRRLQAQGYLILGTFYQRNGQIHESLMYFEEALDVSRAINAASTRLESLKSLSEIYQEMSRWNISLNFYKQYHEEFKLLFNQDASKEIDKMKANEASREARLFKKMYDQVAVISQMGQEITSSLNLKEVVHIIYKELNEIMDAPVVGLGFYNEEEQKVEYRHFMEKEEWSDPFEMDVTFEGSFGSWCVHNKKEVVVNDVEIDYKKYFDNLAAPIQIIENEIQSIIYIPLMVSNKVIGILSVQSYNKNAYDQYQIEVFKALASYVSIAVENAKLYEIVEIMATQDPLTHLYNRAHFNYHAEREFLHYRRTGTEFSIIMFDLDHFKKVNDTYGHDGGDIVLKGIAETLGPKMRQTDLFCRWGGEEFIILLPDTQLEQALLVAQRLHDTLNKHRFDLGDGNIIPVTASFGVSCIKAEDDELKRIIKRSDIALYESKANGRNMITVFEDLPEGIV